jgi:hypothetical protein
MVSLAILKVIKEVLILKFKAYLFVNDVLLCFQLLTVAKVTSTLSLSFSNTSLSITFLSLQWFPVSNMVKQN